MPSMVITVLYSLILLIFLVHDLTTLPSRITEQAPQTPVPHPTFVPVRPSLLSTEASVSVSGLHINVRSAPLIFNVIFCRFIICLLQYLFIIISIKQNYMSIHYIFIHTFVYLYTFLGYLYTAPILSCSLLLYISPKNVLNSTQVLYIRIYLFFRKTVIIAV